MRPIRGIVLHHSLTPDGPLLSVEAIRRYHMEHNGWRDIGYHVLIDRVDDKEEIVVGRPWDQVGAHAPGRNADTLGLCFVGNFDEAPPDAATWTVGLITVGWLCRVFAVPRNQVLGHREVTANRTCPGQYFDLNRFRAELDLEQP